MASYNQEKVKEIQLNTIDELAAFKGNDNTHLVVVEGLTKVNLIEQIATLFTIHQLVLEDILNTHQRPKLEAYDNYIYIVLKSMHVEHDEFEIVYEQISLLMVENFVIVFKEKQDNLFKPLIKRIIKSKGQIRTSGSDYLAYAILDTIVDRYFNVLDALDEEITPLEDSLLSMELDNSILPSIQNLKREVIHLRRHVSPVRDIITEMLRSESELINDKTHIYLRDISDHATRVNESIESHRDILNSLMDIYMSSVSHKMNEIMKVLTIFASIFIPLTFIVGIYGMNFEFMPELKWKWAYPSIWATFILIPSGLLINFKRKKWI